MTAVAPDEAPLVTSTAESLWFLGTLVRLKLTGKETGGRFALWEGVLPGGAAPPLHSHPQDETFYVIEGELTAWLVEPGCADDRSDPLPGLPSRRNDRGSRRRRTVPGLLPSESRASSVRRGWSGTGRRHLPIDRAARIEWCARRRLDSTLWG